MLSISMVTNILVTSLTAGRIRYVAFMILFLAVPIEIFWRYVARTLDAKYFGPSVRRYRFVIVLIVESGVFMAISKIIEFTLFQLAPDDGLNGLNALYIPMDCMPQIMVGSLFNSNRCDFSHLVSPGYLPDIHLAGSQCRSVTARNDNA